MPEKTLFGQLQPEHIWLAVLTALWGGTTSYIRRITLGHRHSWMSATLHMISSGFAGLICWLGCVQFEVPPALTAICTGLAGHMGVEFIKIVEARFKARINEVAMPQRRRSSDTGSEVND